MLETKNLGKYVHFQKQKSKISGINTVSSTSDAQCLLSRVNDQILHSTPMCCAAFPLCLEQGINLSMEDWNIRPKGDCGSQMEACCNGSISLFCFYW